MKVGSVPKERRNGVEEKVKCKDGKVLGATCRKPERFSQYVLDCWKGITQGAHRSKQTGYVVHVSQPYVLQMGLDEVPLERGGTGCGRFLVVGSSYRYRVYPRSLARWSKYVKRQSDSSFYIAFYASWRG